ncbi:MAG: hypothetical protein N2255_00220 [Kiritimatiellae bacterium]|nr:hypothetical protein [Kiritimatiellia bacterium]
MSRRFVLFGLSVGIALGLLTGCKPSADRLPGSVQTSAGEPPDEFYLPAEVRRHLEAGNTNAAIGAIGRILQTETNSERRVHLFGLEQRLMLRCGREEEAKARILSLIGKDDALVGSGLGIIPEDLWRRGEHAALDKWLETLIASPLQPPLLAQVYAMRTSSLAERGEVSRLVELVPETMARLGDDRTRLVWLQPLGALLGNNDLDGLSRLLDTLRQWTAERPQVRVLHAVFSIRLLLAKGELLQAAQNIRENLETLGEGEANDVLRHFFDCAIRADKFDEVERMFEFTVAHKGIESLPGTTAVRAWLDAAQKRGGEALMSRLEELEKKGVAAPTMEAHYSARFFDVLKADPGATAPRLIAMGKRIIPRLGETNRIEQVRALLLDAAVLTDDYEAALGILQDGYRASDKAWREMAENKLRAHLALRQGNKQEAVERFRSFMRYIAEHGENTTDPVSGLTYTREMTLARNALRIADILSSMSDTNAAFDAYREAQSYYTRALTNLPPDSAESRFVRSELDKLSTTLGLATQIKENKQ